MANAFTSVTNTKNDVRKNVWDWSHVNNITTEIGRITPCFARRVPANFSLRIKTDFALQFMPMMFPIQSDIKARISFFKMPVRALWKNYRDWISSVNMTNDKGESINSKYVPPYISISTKVSDRLYSRFNNYFGVGSDLDYMGLPSTYDEVPAFRTAELNIMPPTDVYKPTMALASLYPTGNVYPLLGSAVAPSDDYLSSVIESGSYDSLTNFLTLFYKSTNNPTTISSNASNRLNAYYKDNRLLYVPISFANQFSLAEGSDLKISLNYSPGYYLNSGAPQNFSLPDPVNAVLLLSSDDCFTLPSNGYYSTDSAVPSNISLGGNVSGFPVDIPESGLHSEFSFKINKSLSANSGLLILEYPSQTFGTGSDTYSLQQIWTPVSTQPPLTVSYRPSVLYSPETSPWFDLHTGKGLRVSSLFLRMREAVYNAYMRDIRNNPLSLDGTKKYNDWVLCYDKDGNDSINYSELKIDGELDSLEYFYGRKYANWEPDYLTTCVQSPQEGQAPLVGLTTYATQVSDENGVITQRLNSVISDEDGKTYSLSFKSDAEGLKGVEYTELSEKDDLGRPIATVYDAVTSGISIEDFRQVNAYQRYLELNMRRGYSYKDIIEGRYDVNVRYDDLLMPEFCGGFTRDMQMNAVTQTTPTDESGTYQGALGSKAGDGFVTGSPESSISIFCDEDSIVMAFISITPTPIYAQTLSKDFLIEDPLDIWSPEFSNIGFQPVTLKEVAPIQAYNNNPNSLDSVFGYQRPWYEFLGMTDQAHGLYRSQMQNFIMRRIYSDVPALSKEFLLVKPDQVNQVFSVVETTDKVFGQIRFDIKCRNGIPRNNVPRIE